MKSRIFSVFMLLSMSSVTSVYSKAIIEYTDSNDFNKKIIKSLKPEEKIEINLEKFGWSKCEINSNDTKSAIHAKCWVDKKRFVSFSCWGDESVEIDVHGNGLASVKLICTFK